MEKYLQQQLLALNKAFYTTVAEPFDSTRLAPSAGKSELVRRLPLAEIAHRHGSRAALVDVGCGNGRLAWLLEERGVPLAYVGVDANAQLLALAQEHTATLRHVETSFVQADLAEPAWNRLVPKPAQGFDIVTCLATLHHLPGYDLRCAVMQSLASLLAPGGILAISTWQFLTTARLVAKQVAWAEIGIDDTQVELGDALLPWNQGGYAVRFVHQIDLDEVTKLAAAARLSIEETYFADGKEGNLNLYTILRHPPDQRLLDERDAP
jgi:tRNA (uracil-5-)-methyltransferase TRM9